MNWEGSSLSMRWSVVGIVATTWLEKLSSLTEKFPWFCPEPWQLPQFVLNALHRSLTK